MSDNRSIIALEHYWESEQRFEYFVTDISTALCAYAGQTLQPQRFGENPYTLEVFSLALIVTSLIFGFKRIELGISLKALNHHILHLGEVPGALMPILLQGGFNRLSGEFLTADDVAKQIASINRDLPAVEKNIKTAQSEILRYYDYRNVFLLLGKTVC